MFSVTKPLQYRRFSDFSSNDNHSTWNFTLHKCIAKSDLKQLWSLQCSVEWRSRISFIVIIHNLKLGGHCHPPGASTSARQERQLLTTPG